MLFLQIINLLASLIKANRPGTDSSLVQLLRAVNHGLPNKEAKEAVAAELQCINIIANMLDDHR